MAPGQRLQAAPIAALRVHSVFISISGIDAEAALTAACRMHGKIHAGGLHLQPPCLCAPRPYPRLQQAQRFQGIIAEAERNIYRP